MSDARRFVGAFGEGIAKDYLEKHGYEVIQTNFRCSVGEIDIVARDKDYIVFVEVRTRRSSGFGTPEESITPAKKAKLIDLAHFYLQEHGDPSSLWRIDVVAVDLGPGGKISEVRLIRNAID